MQNAWDKPHKELDKYLESRNVFYSVDSDMNDTAIIGTAVLVMPHDEFWGEGEDYVSEPVTNPTWLELAILADAAIKRTGDYHHSFFEGVCIAGRYREEAGRKVNGVPAWEFIMGS